MEPSKVGSKSPERQISPERSTTTTTTKSTVRTESPSPTRKVSPTRGSVSPQRVRSPSPSKTSRGKYESSWTGRSKVDIRQNFSEEVEQEINDLIHLLMIGGYQCLAMATYFDRDEVGLFGMAHFAK